MIESTDKNRPLGKKSYGSIPHLPGSKVGPGEYHISDGQAKIATLKARDKHDFVIVQEKLDGSNVGVVKLDNEILAITRAGYLAISSPYEQHHLFTKWVELNKTRFLGLLNEGERVCGEWLAMAHGTLYKLIHEPFVPFDIMTGTERANYETFKARTREYDFVNPLVISIGQPFPIDHMLTCLEAGSGHGAIDPVEGAVWRVERKGKVDFLCKYVRPEKENGKYFADMNNGKEVWNIGLENYIKIK